MLPLFILIASFVPNFVWLALYVREDPHQEPRPLLVLAFFLGMCGTGIALALEYALLRAVSAATGLNATDVYNSLWYMFMGVALVEEAVKFALARAVLFRFSSFDEPIDAMIYLIVIALGFAFVENVIIIGNALLPASGSVTDVMRTVMFRFIGANFLHLLASGIMGYFWARGIMARKQERFVALGFGIAVLIHGVFNAIMLTLGSLAYVVSLAFVFAAGIVFMRDLELLRQLSATTTLTVYYPRKK